MPKDKEIENFEQLKTEYQNAKEDAEKRIKISLKKFSELMKALPDIKKEGTLKGLSDKMKEIDEKFGVNFSDIENEMSVTLMRRVVKSIDELDKNLNSVGKAESQSNKDISDKVASTKKENEKWEKDNDKRSKVITGTITNVKNKSTDRKEKIALKAVKVTSVIGKGLVLFGQKDLAESMNKAVTEKGKDFVSKDSRIGKIMERVAEGGFFVEDGTKKMAKTVRDGAESVVETVSTKAKNAKTSIEKEIKARRNAFDDVGKRTNIDLGKLNQVKKDKEFSNDEWQQVNADRNKLVTKYVKEIDKNSVNQRTKTSKRSVKVAGVVARGVALFGPKGLAEKMQNKIYKRAEQHIGKDSIESQLAKGIADKGFEVSTNIKESALEFGSKHYKGVAVIGALKNIGLSAVKTGAGKVEKGVEDIADKVEKGVEKIPGIVNDYRDQAKNKIQDTREYQGFAKFAVNMAKSVIKKLEPTIKGKEPEPEEEKTNETKTIVAKEEDVMEM